MDGLGLSYFKTHSPLSEERVELKQPSAHQLAFADEVLRQLSPIAAKWGFARMLTEVGTYYSTLLFVNQDRAIKVNASTDYRDAPAFYNVILSRLQTDGQWWSIALWHLARVVDDASNATEFPFPMEESERQASLMRAILDLESYAETFLKGDFQYFEMARRRFAPHP